MVYLATTFIGAVALLAQVSNARPMPQDDSSIGQEVAVSAPNGIPLTDTAELASQSAREAKASASQNNGDMNTQATTTMMMGESMTQATTTMMMEESTKTKMHEATSTSMAYGGYNNGGNNGGYNNGGYNGGYNNGGYNGGYSSANYNNGYNSYSSSASYNNGGYNNGYQGTTTTSAYQSYNTYGSGSSNWGGNDYNNCVQQCVASYGSPMATYTPSSSSNYNGGYGGSSGNGGGVTHTVIVAPKQGVLRYVPFATNASIGDTIKFMWNANVHTVTKGSQLELCNKTSDGLFTSGSQNQSFVFTQVVNSTDPTFYYCATPGHCQKGMFGIINPPSALTASTSVANMMPSMIQNNSDMAAMAAYTDKQTLGNKAASTWGGSIDLAKMPEWSKPFVAQNVMYARTFLAANPEVIKDDGSVDLGAAGSNPLMVPADLAVALQSNTASTSSAASPAATSSGAAAAATTPAAGAQGQKSGARSLTSSGAVAAVVAVAATVFAL